MWPSATVGVGGCEGGWWGEGFEYKRSVKEGTFLLVDGKGKKLIVRGRLRSEKTRIYLH